MRLVHVKTVERMRAGLPKHKRIQPWEREENKKFHNKVQWTHSIWQSPPEPTHHGSPLAEAAARWGTD